MNDAQRIRRLPLLVASNGVHAIFHALAVGTTLVLFYDELGLDKAQIGLLRSLMHLLGPLAIFIGPFAVRFGLKRTVILFYGSRKLILAMLALAPWMAAYYSSSAFYFIALILALYGLWRVIAETALYPWLVEVIPNSVRGKFEAFSNMASTFATLAAIAVASHVIETYTGLWRFQILIVSGAAIGAVSVLLMLFLPGGEPESQRTSRAPDWRELRRALGDRNLRAYLIGFCASLVPTSAWSVFVPLYLVQEVGLAAGVVVLLQSASVAGGFLSSYFWGWAADRFGSKPVALSGLMLNIALPLGWLVMPHGSLWSQYWAATISLLAGVAGAAGSIGLTRMLYASIVPPEKKLEYMAVYYTAKEIAYFASPPLAGLLLTWIESGGSTLFGMTSYAFFFSLAAVMCVGSLLMVSRIDDQGSLSTLELWARLPGVYPALREAVRKQMQRRKPDEM